MPDQSFSRQGDSAAAELISVIRVPASNGEWVDLHRSKSGAVWVSTSGYAAVAPDAFRAALDVVTCECECHKGWNGCACECKTL